jgi:hypothetical protein
VTLTVDGARAESTSAALLRRKRLLMDKLQAHIPGFWRPSPEQEERLQAGEIDRVTLGVYRCPYVLHELKKGAETLSPFWLEALRPCDNHTPWEWFADRGQSTCPSCGRQGVLVELVER